MILLPRPAPHLPHTVQIFQEARLTDLFPLALSHPQSVSITIPTGATAYIITSPFALQPGLPGLPCYCVGETTAETTQSHGLQVLHTGTSDGAALARHLATLPPQHFVHLHGDYAGQGWYTTLTAEGHTVTPCLAYHTNRVTTLPEDFPQADVTCLFSAGTATHLANLMKHANMQPSGTAIALSPAVAAAAVPHWPRVVTAPQPTLASMVATIAGLHG